MATMTTTITLTPEQSAHLKELVAVGGYSSPEDAVADSIEILREAHIASKYTPSARARIYEGIDASLRGELVSQEEIEADLDDWERELRA
jgi:predicted transcriptional regulator